MQSLSNDSKLKDLSGSVLTLLSMTGSLDAFKNCKAGVKRGGKWTGLGQDPSNTSWAGRTEAIALHTFSWLVRNPQPVLSV